MRIPYFTLLVSIELLAFGSLAGAGEVVPLAFEVRPTSPAFVKGQAIVLTLHFENRSEKPLAIQLGADGKEHVSLSIKKGKQGQIAKWTNPGGFRAHDTIRIKPGKNAFRFLVVDEFAVLDGTGEYHIEVSVGEEGVFRAATTVKVIPTVKERCRELWQRSNNMKIRSDERDAALTALCHTRHESALDYQKKIILHGPAGSLEYQTVAVRSIILTGKAEGIRFLVSEVLAKKPAKKVSTRDVVLHQFCSVGTKHLDERDVKLLKPYEGEIAKATPITISD